MQNALLFFDECVVLFASRAQGNALMTLFTTRMLDHGFLAAGATMGQLLSLPLVVVGAWLIYRAPRAP